MEKSKSYSQMRKAFQNLYFTNVVPWLIFCDKERKKNLVLAIAKTIVSAIVAVVMIYYAFIFNKEGLFNFSFLFICYTFLAYYIDKKVYESKIKENIMPKVCKCFGDLVWKSSNSYNSNNMAKYCFDSSLISNFSRVDVDDVFAGSYLGVNYEIIEMKIFLSRGKFESKVFGGVVLKLDMNKKFSGNTVIKPDSVMHMSPSSKLKHTQLEDVVFEKKFDVFTDDEVEARYLITPSFMQRLNDLKLAFGASQISCSFYESNLLISLTTSKDLFSLCSLIKPLNDDKQFFTMFEELLSIIKLIDHFKLNQKIGL